MTTSAPAWGQPASIAPALAARKPVEAGAARDLVGDQVGHVVVDGDQPGAGEGAQRGCQPLQRGGTEVGEDDIGVEVEGQEVGDEDLALEPVRRQRLLRLIGETLVDLDADDACAAPGRGYEHLTVAATEIDEAVAAADFG